MWLKWDPENAVSAVAQGQHSHFGFLLNARAPQVRWSFGSNICSAVAASNFMIYKGVEFVIRAGLGRHEWTLLICYPDNVNRSPTVSQFSGSMGDATASARRRIDGWMRRQRRKARASA